MITVNIDGHTLEVSTSNHDPQPGDSICIERVNASHSDDLPIHQARLLYAGEVLEVERSLSEISPGKVYIVA